jgi:hypothetical protein
VNAAFNGEQHVRALPAAGATEQAVCRFHAQSSCKFGDACALRHVGPAGSGKGSPKGSPKGGGKGPDGKGRGKGKQKGKTGKGPDRSQSPSQSPRTKNLPCYGWNDGKCDRNPCPFVHRALTEAEKKARQPPRPRSPAAAGAKVCKFFMNGNCNKGKDCKDQHPGNSSVPGTPRPRGKKKSGGAAGTELVPQS